MPKCLKARPADTSARNARKTKKGIAKANQSLRVSFKKSVQREQRNCYDDIAIDNSSVALFRKCGFVEVMQTSEYILVKKGAIR